MTLMSRGGPPEILVDGPASGCGGYAVMPVFFSPVMPVTLNAGFKMPSWFDLTSLEVDAPEDAQGIKSARDKIHGLIADEVTALTLNCFRRDLEALTTYSIKVECQPPVHCLWHTTCAKLVVQLLQDMLHVLSASLICTACGIRHTSRHSTVETHIDHSFSIQYKYFIYRIHTRSISK